MLVFFDLILVRNHLELHCARKLLIKHVCCSALQCVVVC